jgi:hypothetical protein
VLAAGARLQRVRRLRRVLKALHKVGRILAADERVLARALNVAAPAPVGVVEDDAGDLGRDPFRVSDP